MSADRYSRLGPLGFTLLLFSMTACLPLFFLGPIAYQSGLSLSQALAGALVGNSIIGLAMVLNGLHGLRSGEGFNEHARRVFGGLHGLVVALRGLVGGLWYGVEAYNGALALTMIVLALLAGREAALREATVYLPLALLFYVAAATLVYRSGMRSVGRAATVAGPLLFLYLALLLARTGMPGEALGRPGAGWLSAPMLGYIAIQASWWATVAINVSDLTRHARSAGTVAIGVALGLVGGQVLGTLIGYLLAVQSGTGLPQEAILSGEASTALAVLGLLFAFLAPWTTDLAANIPALDDALRLKLPPTKSPLIAGALGLVLAPWYLLDKAQDIVGYVASFAASYGTLLGPILGAMTAATILGAAPLTAGAAALLGLAASYAYATATNSIEIIRLGPAPIPFPPGITILIGIAVSAAVVVAARIATPKPAGHAEPPKRGEGEPL